MNAGTCQFCTQLGQGEPEPLAERPTAVSLPEGRPHATGHAVVIPRRHVGRLTELSEHEHHELFALAREVTLELQRAHQPDAFTLGMNDGPAAGQSTPHVHLHIVPRTSGDVEDPRGGIRRALPPPLTR